MRKVLAFFGAFNPPTVAHLELADFARKETGREGVIFVPSKTDYIRNSQRKDTAYSDAERLVMLERLAEKRPWLRVTDWEIRQPEQPRTYTTLCHLRDEGNAASLLLGSDKLPELSGWKYAQEIAREFGIVILARGKDSCSGIIQEDPFLTAVSDCIRVLETPAEWRDISSSAVRETLRRLQALEAELARMVPEEICSMLRGGKDQRRNTQ